MLCQHKSARTVETRSLSQPGYRPIDHVAPESASTIIQTSGSPLRSATGSRHDDSLTRRSVESGRKAPVGGLALTPKATDCSMFNGERLATVSKVDRCCSPFRVTDLSTLGIRTQTDVPADTARTMSPSRPRRSFAASTSTGRDLKTYEDRRATHDGLDTRSTDLGQSQNQTRNFRRAVDYRREAQERQRHLQVLESNRTLEKFMRVLRMEKEAKATAALFSKLSTVNSCRQCSRTVSFAMDKECHPMTSSAITSSRDGTGNPWSMTRYNSPTARLSANTFRLPLDKQKHQLGISKGSNLSDFEHWTKHLEDRPRRTSTPRRCVFCS